jgi:two-component system sensor histidine kinase KdpD
MQCRGHGWGCADFASAHMMWSKMASTVPIHGKATASPGTSLASSPAEIKPLSATRTPERQAPPQPILWGHYQVAFGVFVAVSLLNLWLQKWLGYQAIALVYLLPVVLLARFVGRGPILFCAALTAIGWSFIFAPPRFSIHIAGTYDKMMVVTYFAVALTIGQLTARLREHQEAELHAKLLTESERLSRTVLNSVSHELRTPIAAIISAASTLKSAGNLSPVQTELAGEIEAASSRLNRFVQSLLGAARLQSGTLRPKMDWCDIRDIVRNSLRDVQDIAEGRAVATRFGSNLPLIKLDSVLTEQALINLLVNAVTHTPVGSPIDISVRMEGKTMILEVADRGPGLPPDQLERVFELFHRAPKATPGGTGLGLAIVKGFIEAQRGSATAANRPGGGAVFTLRLPADAVPTLPEEIA